MALAGRGDGEVTAPSLTPAERDVIEAHRHLIAEGAAPEEGDETELATFTRAELVRAGALIVGEIERMDREDERPEE